MLETGQELGRDQNPENCLKRIGKRGNVRDYVSNVENVGGKSMYAL